MKRILHPGLLGLAFGAPTHHDRTKNALQNDRAVFEMPDMVDPGTYLVTTDKIDADEHEIFVTTPDGKHLELFVGSQTVLTQGEKAVTLNDLKEGQELEVKVEKDGQMLMPMEVRILE